MRVGIPERFKPLLIVAVVASVTMISYQVGVMLLEVPNERPLAVAGEDRMVLVDERVQFDASLSHDPDGRVEEYLWDFGDGRTSPSSATKHSFSTPGEFKVTLTVWDEDGASDTDFMNVTVVTELPLEIREPASMVFNNTVVVTWYTNKAASTAIQYGTTRGALTLEKAGGGNLTRWHTVSITGLASGQTYYYEARSERGDEAVTAAHVDGWPLNFTAGTDSYAFYFGNTHAHTSYSDGQGTPREAYAFARDVANIDFLEITDHGHMLEEWEWDSTLEAAEEASQEDAFVALRGFEWTSSVGHMNSHGSTDWTSRIETSVLSDWYEWLDENGNVPGTFNHPAPGWGDWYGFRYSEAGDRAVSTIEAGSSRGYNYEDAYIEALDNGWHISPVYGQDNHDWTWGASSTGLTGIVASGLTGMEVYKAYANMRTTCLWDRMELLLVVNGELMGGTVGHDGNASVTLSAKDVTFKDETATTEETEEPERFALLELYLDGVAVNSTQPDREQFLWQIDLNVGPGNHYIFAKVTQDDGDVGYTAPVWLL